MNIISQFFIRSFCWELQIEKVREDEDVYSHPGQFIPDMLSNKTKEPKQ